MAKQSSTTAVITRFAPSPTGLLHAGNYRTALFSYLFAKQNNGSFVLRIEDTDKARSKKEYEDNIIESLKWLNIGYDDFYRQSDRSEIHKKYIQTLIDKGHAYVSKETPTEEGGRTEVIRFKNPNKKIKFNDLIRGDIEFDTTELGDFVIAKSLTEPIFHLVVVVDDFEMGITHIIRGEDHISNTPRHILIQEAIGAPQPIYAHLPLILSPDRSKLSKRKGALAITEYRARGYEPEAMVNFLALLGWNPGTTQEVLSIEELIKLFDMSKVQKAGAIFNEEKLQWINKQYINAMSEEMYLEKAKAFLPAQFLNDEKVFKKIALLGRERISTFGELNEMALKGEFGYFIDVPHFPKEKLLWKDEKDFSKTKTHLAKAIEIITNITEENFNASKIKEAIWPYAEEVGRGSILWPMRYALSGKDKSPDPFTLSELLGKEETLKRLSRAHDEI